jgi:hypothetical protein
MFDVAGRSDQIAEAMIVGMPQACRENHHAIIRSAARSTKRESAAGNSFALSARKWR